MPDELPHDGDPSGLRAKRAGRKMGSCPETGRSVHVPGDLTANADATKFTCHWCRKEVTLDG